MNARARLPASERLLIASVWLFGLLWSTSAISGGDSFAAAVDRFDLGGLLRAMVVAAVGGTARTVLSLGRRKVLVLDTLHRLLTDILSSLIAGAVAFIAFIALSRLTAWTIDYDLMVVTIFFAGWTRDSWLRRVDDFSGSIVDRALDRASRALGVESTKKEGEGSDV